MNSFRFIFRIIFFTAFVLCLCDASAQDAKKYFDKGREFLIKGKYNDAISSFDDAILKDNSFAQAYALRGYAWLLSNDYVKAIDDYTTAIRLHPDTSRFYVSRGEAYGKKEKTDSAILDYSKAISLDLSNTGSPLLKENYQNRAALYYKKGRYDSAIFDYNNAIKLMTRTDTAGFATNYLGRYRAYYFSNQIDSALKDINTLISRYPKSAGFYNNRGLCYNSLGEYESAIMDFLTSLVNRTPTTSGNAYLNIMSPLVRLKRFNEAALFHKLYFKNKADYKLNSFLYDTKDTVRYKFYRYFVKAVAEVADNKLQHALASLDTATKEYGSGVKDETKRLYVDILFLNGYILEKLSRYSDAKANYEQSLVIDKRQPDVTEALDELNDKKIAFRFNDRSGPVLDEEELFISEPKNVKSSDSREFSLVSDSVRYQVNGKATDESGIDSVLVNDIPVERLEENGDFRTKITVKAGTPSLTIKVKDKKSNETFYEHRFATAAAVTEQAAAVPAEDDMGKYYAILIAEKDYIDPKFEDLKYPVRDANKLREVLINNYTFDEKNVDTLFNRSREDILETIIARCKALGKNDNLLIFYAGHGDTTLDIKGDPNGYLIPTTAQNNKTSYYITPDEINKAVYNSHAKHILILLDACFSGSFTREAGHDIDGDVLLQWKTKSRKIMSSGNLSPVPDKSSFIEYLAEFLTTNEKPFVSAKDMWPFVDSRVRAQLKNQENAKYYDPQYAPLIVAGDLGGSFIFQRRKK